MLVAHDQHPPKRREDYIPRCLQRYKLDARFSQRGTCHYRPLLYSKFEISAGIIIGDILHDLAQGLHVSRVLAAFHPVPQKVAEDPAEILVAGVREEASGVSEH